MKTKMKVELKMENATRTFREMNVVLQLVYKLQIKYKTLISWSLRKKKECIFCNVFFIWKTFFNICVLSWCSIQFLVYP